MGVGLRIQARDVVGFKSCQVSNLPTPAVHTHPPSGSDRAEGMSDIPYTGPFARRPDHAVFRQPVRVVTRLCFKVVIAPHRILISPGVSTAIQLIAVRRLLAELRLVGDESSLYPAELRAHDANTTLKRRDPVQRLGSTS
jgi:hypothetical protein